MHRRRRRALPEVAELAALEPAQCLLEGVWTDAHIALEREVEGGHGEEHQPDDEGERGVGASGPEVRLRRWVLSCHLAVIPRCPGPSSCPYSPECVEEEFSEVQGSKRLLYAASIP